VGRTAQEFLATIDSSAAVAACSEYGGPSNIRPLPNRKNLLRIDYGKL
jgi:hypothetical protein